MKLMTLKEIRRQLVDKRKISLSFKELKTLFFEKVAQDVRRRKKMLRLDDVRLEIRSEKLLEKIKERLKRVPPEELADFFLNSEDPDKLRGMVDDCETIGEILDRVLFIPDSEITELLGKSITPFPALDVVTEFAGPYWEDALFIDSLAVASWYSMNFRGEEQTPRGTINNREYRFAKGFWEVFSGMAEKNDWFMLLNHITLEDMLKYQRSIAGDRGSVPDSINGQDFLGCSVGSVISGLGEYFQSWDPGKCTIEKYNDGVIKACGIMTSLIHALISGYFDINERIDYYKSHGKAELAALADEERRSRLREQPIQQAG